MSADIEATRQAIQDDIEHRTSRTLLSEGFLSEGFWVLKPEQMIPMAQSLARTDVLRWLLEMSNTILDCRGKDGLEDQAKIDEKIASGELPANASMATIEMYERLFIKHYGFLSTTANGMSRKEVIAMLKAKQPHVTSGEYQPPAQKQGLLSRIANKKRTEI